MRSWMVGVLRIELLHLCRRIGQVRRVFPTIVFGAPTLPMDEVLQLLAATPATRVEDGVDFVFFLPLHLDRCRLWRVAIGERALLVREKERNVEDRVDAKVLGECELVREVADATFDGVRSSVAVDEFA